MQMVGKVFWIIFLCLSCVGAVVIVNYAVPDPPEEQREPLLYVFKDEMQKIPVENGVLFWEKVTEFNYTFTQRVFVFNPKNYTQSVRVYWEFYPSELVHFSEFWSDSNVTIGAYGMSQVNFALRIRETVLITNFEVMTKIEGEL